MSLADLARLGTLLSRIARPPLPQRAAREVEERRNLVSSNGLLHDRYRHRHGDRALIVALHGVSPNGNQDQRMVHLGRCLAASGATCLAPRLPGLSALQWTASDIDALSGFIREQNRPVGLLGFSYAGAYALVTAARPEVADRIGFVLSFGGYHSLPELYDHYLAVRNTVPADDKQWDDRVYLHLVMASRNLGGLEIPDRIQAGVDSWLRRYCHDPDLQGKREFYQQQLAGLDLVLHDHRHQDRTELEHLSPAGKLGDLKCRVGILHDPTDSLVPENQARALADELKSCGVDHRLLITPLLSHVNLSGALNLPEWVRMFSILMPMVEARR